MNINYHYFTVRVLTAKAGFTEDDAQLLASYSQFVDDFDTYKYLFFKDVPSFAQYLAVKTPLGWSFNPVTTGFNSFFDYARLSIDTNQKKILVPFHFITQDPINVTKSDRKEYRVTPVTMDHPSLLQSLLKKASDTYKTTSSRENLIRIGTLLHVFADSYAHQQFSGYWNWENHSYLENAINNIDNTTITSSYSPDKYYYVPSIGHPNVSTAPDDSNISFTMQQKYEESEKFPYKARYTRSNTLEYIKASREILNYLRGCRGIGKIDDVSWNQLAAKITKGLLTPERATDKLKDHWSNIFPEITFSYSKDEQLTKTIKVSNLESVIDLESFDDLESANNATVLNIFNNKFDPDKTIILEASSDDFFHYNVIADQIRKAVDPSFTVDHDFARYANEFTLKSQHLLNTKTETGESKKIHRVR